VIPAESRPPIDQAVKRKLTWEGPHDYVCHEVAQATGGSALLVPGTSYELPDELAEQLLRSSPYWVDAPAAQKERK